MGGHAQVTWTQDLHLSSRALVQSPGSYSLSHYWGVSFWQHPAVVASHPQCDFHHPSQTAMFWFLKKPGSPHYSIQILIQTSSMASRRLSVKSCGEEIQYQRKPGL